MVRETSSDLIVLKSISTNVVVAISIARHGDTDTIAAQFGLIFYEALLTAAIQMMNEPLGRKSHDRGLAQVGQRQVALQSVMRLNRRFCRPRRAFSRIGRAVAPAHDGEAVILQLARHPQATIDAVRQCERPSPCANITMSSRRRRLAGQCLQGIKWSLSSVYRMSLNTRSSSTRNIPCDEEKYGSIWRIGASDSNSWSFIVAP